MPYSNCPRFRTLAPARRSMFERATTQKKRSARLWIVTLFERDREQGRSGKNDGFKGRLLDLAAEKQGDRAVVVLIIGIMMNEFVQAWADDQDCSPLEHGSQKQRDHLRTDEGGGILSGARLFGFWFAVHERLERLASREERGRRRILKGSLDYCKLIATILLQGEESITSIWPLPAGQGSFMQMARSQ
jgi:hypothetical protein